MTPSERRLREDMAEALGIVAGLIYAGAWVRRGNDEFVEFPKALAERLASILEGQTVVLKTKWSK